MLAAVVKPASRSLNRFHPWRLCATVCLLALALATCARPRERANLLLIAIDTLRADRLSCAGYGRETTPNLDRLAAEGLRFTRVESPRAKTTPAVASLFSGLYPHDHGVRDLVTPLPADVPTLAEHLAARGWDTAAIVGNFVLRDALSGLSRGFRTWIEDLPERTGVPPDDAPQRTARSLTDGALAALGLGRPSADGAGPHAALFRSGRPWFLYLHYMDPHGAYAPPPEHDVFRSVEPDPIPRDPGPNPANGAEPWIATYNVPPSDRLADGRIDAARVRDRYDGEVRYADAEIGRLLEALRATGALANTWVVVVADHGESLGEHRYWFEHGRHAYEVTCRVPLIVRPPDGLRARPAPGVRDGDVSLADLAPTLCDWLDVDPLRSPPRTRGPRGRSLAALLARDAPRARAVFCEKVERTEKLGAIQTKGVRLGDWKLLRRLTELPTTTTPGGRRLVVLTEELYDLAHDPGETRNLVRDPPIDAPLDRLRAELVGFIAADVDLPGLADELQRLRERLGASDPETLRALESLGY